MTDIAKIAEGLTKVKPIPSCRDFDEDCEDIPDKVHCYLYDPAKGMCPYLKEQHHAE
jgi:hypothetical protein